LDQEFGNFLCRRITKEIHQADLLLNGLLNYFEVSFPTKKTGTVNILIEDVLRENQVRLKEKEVRIFRKLEKDLPEIVVPEKPLRYILNSILQYAVTYIPFHETLGLLTQSFYLHEPGQDQPLLGKREGYVGITLFFTGYKKSVECGETGLEIGTFGREEGTDLFLQLVKEVAHRNRGVMKIKVDEKEAKVYVVLEFPVERRTTLYYQNDNSFHLE
jgi:sensor histidine kinase YesM